MPPRGSSVDELTLANAQEAVSTCLHRFDWLSVSISSQQRQREVARIAFPCRVPGAYHRTHDPLFTLHQILSDDFSSPSLHL